MLAYADRMPAIYGEGGRWRLFVRAWLLLHGNRAALVDTGVGPVCEWFPRPGRLHDALSDAGVSADAIDTVIITHVHDDHIGGTVADGRAPAFPNARYLVQRADVEWYRHAAERNGEERAIWDRLLQPLFDAGVLEELEGNERLTDEIEVRHAPGHTPGHQIVRVASEGRRLAITSDAFIHPGQLAHPEWASTSDHDPAGVAETRRELLAELLAEQETVVAPTHFDAAFGHILRDADGLAVWRPLA